MQHVIIYTVIFGSCIFGIGLLSAIRSRGNSSKPKIFDVDLMFPENLAEYFWLADAAGEVKLYTCSECGAIVRNCSAHLSWHERTY